MLHTLKKILNILFPIECLGCGKQNVLFCDKCFKKIKINKVNFFNNEHINQVHVATSFKNNLIQKIIHLYKYQYMEKLSEHLSKLLVNYYSQVNSKLNNPIIIPVPLHKKRFKIRCFNQSLLIAEKFAEHYNYVLNNRLIKRIKHTKQQAKLKKEQRILNIQNAFKIIDITTSNSPLVKGRERGCQNKNFIIIDDIYTTGSTVSEIAKVLKNNGAKEIWCLVIAKN